MNKSIYIYIYKYLVQACGTPTRGALQRQVPLILIRLAIILIVNNNTYCIISIILIISITAHTNNDNNSNINTTPLAWITGFQTGSGQTGPSQKCREFPLMNFDGKMLIQFDKMWQNIAKYGNACALKTNYYIAKCLEAWPFCENPVCPWAARPGRPGLAPGGPVTGSRASGSRRRAGTPRTAEPGSQGTGGRNSWLGCLLLSILYMFKPSCRPMFRPPFSSL